MTVINLVLKMKGLNKEGNERFLSSLKQRVLLLLHWTVCIKSMPGSEYYILTEFGQRS